MPELAAGARCWYRRDGNVIELRIRVIPRAHQAAFGSVRGDRLVIRVNSPPTQGKANARLRQFLAAAFGCRQRDVELVNGEHDRDKVVRIYGIRTMPVALL
ncbi:MAG: DUF167 domain-containing protein [Arenicellales bacterium]|jgi:hypothetical protein|nr:DUF167 domain-containing protein [Arenicellales bacterium]